MLSLLSKLTSGLPYPVAKGKHKCLQWITQGVFWDAFDLPIAASFNPYFVVSNLTKALETIKGLVGLLRLFYYCEDDPVSDDMHVKIGGNDPLSKSARARSMIGNILMWAVLLRTRPDDSTSNIVIVSDSFSDEPELVRVLEALKQLNFNILLVSETVSVYCGIFNENGGFIISMRIRSLLRCVLGYDFTLATQEADDHKIGENSPSINS
ncbi:hypothetical protein Bca52824_069539 [Brassica carinata]|uniref:NYN domain-containing protein n=1 Tax=Brassica carinata TaxID=52824 RepID=A0A8X7Q2R1_BRACI|nr:hypothetical protein Bca52824_069539 [Brassica carinata]